MLTLIDVSTAKVGRKLGEAIMEASPEPILLLDNRLRLLRANRRFDETFGVSSVLLDGRPLDSLAGPAWKSDELSRTLQEMMTEHRRSAELTLEGEFAEGRRMSISLRARRIEADDAKSDLVLLVIQPGREASVG